ncbi:MAG: MFS transporter [Clostridia bacterium]|nr:MFS transporter [Clostridia bacterium]
MDNRKLSGRIWLNLILFGFMGQIAWAVENVYFNTFLFNSVGGSTRDISRMVALSAVTAVVTTFLMGTLSDRVGKRKPFICFGYIAWGLTVACFAWISRENVQKLFSLSDTAAVVTATVSIVIVMDCLMTFMGSTGNDAAFNAWITDITVPENRGLAEGALSVLPILATLLVSVGFGAGVTAVGYPVCFLILGAVVVLCGVIGLFTVRDTTVKKQENNGYIKDLIYGFRPTVVRENKYLYLSLVCVCIFNTSVQIFMPYLFIYIQHYLKFDFSTLLSALSIRLIVIAVFVLIGFIAVILLFGKLLDKFGKKHFILLSTLVFIGGLVLISFAATIGRFALLAAVMFCGYGLMMIILNATVRDFTPEGKVGQFQGVRMIFAVLIPMVLGSYIGAFVTQTFASRHDLGTYINDYGESVLVPVPEIFAASAILCVLIVVPSLILRKKIR